jgi:hypothetical protein
LPTLNSDHAALVRCTSANPGSRSIARLRERDTRLLHLAIGEQPDERFIVQIDDLDAIPPRVTEVAAKRWDQLDGVLMHQFVAHLSELLFIAHHEADVPVARVSRHSLSLEHREKLVLAEIEERIALSFIQFFQTEDILIKRDRLPDIADLDRDVIAAINLSAHATTLHFDSAAPLVSSTGCTVLPILSESAGTSQNRRGAR